VTVEARCDKCAKSPIVIWGSVSYSPGGGRHGTEEWHFCHECVDALREFAMANVPSIPLGNGGSIFMGNGWMLREDYLKERA
jgi:hypothetical protein